jgi:uncharacterized membrane protein
VLKIIMGTFFAKNIDRRGRIVRAVWGVSLLVAGLLLWERSRWICLALAGFGVFALYEAVRGWCLMRACGIKTRR